LINTKNWIKILYLFKKKNQGIRIIPLIHTGDIDVGGHFELLERENREIAINLITQKYKLHRNYKTQIYRNKNFKSRIICKIVSKNMTSALNKKIKNSSAIKKFIYFDDLESKIKTKELFNLLKLISPIIIPIQLKNFLKFKKIVWFKYINYLKKKVSFKDSELNCNFVVVKKKNMKTSNS
jgi:hypothetical protein